MPREIKLWEQGAKRAGCLSSFKVILRLVSGDSLSIFVSAKAVNISEDGNDRFPLVAGDEIIQVNMRFYRPLWFDLMEWEKEGGNNELLDVMGKHESKMIEDNFEG